jgi:acetyl-CoA C-acetyltransferase
VQTSVIVGGARTPIGSFLGSLSSLSAPQLGSVAIEAAINKAHIHKNDIHQVIMGQVLQGGVGQAPARQASLGAGLSSAIPCTTVNKVCGSGLKAIMMAADAIALGQSSVVVAGGMESMSNAPYLLPNARAGFRMGDHKAVDLMIHDGLLDPYSKAHMGIFGDLCARTYQFTRAQQDDYAKNSYQRAIAAQQQGYFNDEIATVVIKAKGESIPITKDEEPERFRPEKMAALKAAFEAEGTVTAANASKVNDGAAAVVVMSEAEARLKKLPAKARIIAYKTFAHDPQWFTTAPVMAIKAVLNDASLDVAAIDLFEINEAFSVVAMTAIKELALDKNRVNVFGGAVALGHPIGSSGARLVVTLLNALEKHNKRLGCVSVCLGGGEAVAMIVERLR